MMGLMRSLWIAAFVMVPLIIGGCQQARRGGTGNSEDTSSQNLRPTDAPDFIILGISGHDIPLLGSSCPSNYNCEYLSERGTLESIRDIAELHGATAGILTYVDELYSWYYDQNGDGFANPDEDLAIGFLDLLADIEWINNNWIADFDNPTRVIVVAHSHGGVWAHSALMLHPEFPVDILLDLDTNALCWEADLSCLFVGDDWRVEINEFVSTNAPGWWFDVADASDSWQVPGLTELQDIEDIVPSSVFLNVEVTRDGTTAYDNQRNHRLDGTRTNIFTGYFEGETHGGVTDPDSEPMQWALEIIENTYIW